MTSKTIVYINQHSGYLMIDIINAYVAAGYLCFLITGRLVERNTPLHPSVRIERIVKYNRTTTTKRLLTWAVGFIQIWIKVGFKFRNDHLFIVSNPPLAPLLPIMVKNHFKLLIFDIYPDALSELGYLSENSFIIRWWKLANMRVFTRAGTVFTITESMKEVLQRYAGSNLITVVPVWTDNTFLKPIDRSENSFIKRHKLSGKFVVLYSGNIGLSGDVDVLIDVAEKIRRDDIIFLIIGEGAKKQMIREKAKKLDLKNVLFLPWQPVSELPFSLSSASLAVISLGSRASKLAVPSKLYNFLSVGAPLLCTSARGSEVENLVKKYNCGRCFEPDDVAGIVNFIFEVAGNNELHDLYRENSLKASEYFNISNITAFLPSTCN